MWKKLIVAAALVGSLGLTACDKEEPKPAPQPTPQGSGAKPQGSGEKPVLPVKPEAGTTSAAPVVNGPIKPAPAATGKKPRFAYVTNGVADFWTIAAAGATKAAAELKLDVDVIFPKDIVDQSQKIEDLVTRGINGIAISPINPENQGQRIDEAAAKTPLITHDSDAPASQRLVYVGMDNYLAGLMCGKLTRAALPTGGKVMIFIGRLDQDNAKRRRQGTIDGLLGRSPDPKRHDAPGAEVKSEDGKYTVLGTLTDQFDRAKAKSNAEDALTKHPDLAAMVGLFEYNPPAMLEALDRAGKLGKVKVVGFDESSVLLQAIKDGSAVGTVVQNPYMYGYKSMEVLLALHKGDRSVIPADKFINVPARIVRKEASAEPFEGAEVVGVQAFWDDLKAKTGK